MNILKLYLNENLKNNYIYLPKDYVDTNLYSESHLLVTVIKLKKINSDEILFLGWMGGISTKQGIIEISTTLGRSLNIHSGEYVKVFSNNINNLTHEDNKLLDSIELIPLTNYEYKIIENNSAFFEENMLNQIMVVYDGLVFPFVFFDNKVAYLKVNLEEKNKGYILSQDCEVRVAYVKPVIEEENDTVKYIMLKNKLMKFHFNKTTKFDDCLSIKVSKKFVTDNFKINLSNYNENGNENECYNIMKNYVLNISFSKETEAHNNFFTDENILFRISDKSTVNNMFNTIQKYKKSTSKEELDVLIENNFINKFPYRSNFWVNLIIDEFSYDCELNNCILLEEFIKINTILYDNDKIDLTLFNLDFLSSFNDKIYNEFISNYLKIDYFLLNWSHNGLSRENKVIENLIRNKIKDLVKKQENLFLNLDFIYFFKCYLYNDNEKCNEVGAENINELEIILKINFENKTIKDYTEILSRLKINFQNTKMFNKEKNPPHIQPFICLNKIHVKLNIIEHLKLDFNNELNIIYNYNFNNKSYRNILSSGTNSNSNNDLAFLNEFNLKIIRIDLENNSIIKKINKFYKNKNSIGLSIFSFANEYDTKTFLSVFYSTLLTDKLKVNKINIFPITVYINLDIFSFNNINDLKLFENYLKNLFKFYTESDSRNNSKIIFIFEGLERFKKIEQGQNMINPILTEVNNSISYIMTKFINTCNKKNQKSSFGNLYYIIFVLSGGIIDNLPIDYLTKNILFDIIKISYIDKNIVIEILSRFIDLFLDIELNKNNKNDNDNNIIKQKLLLEYSDYCKNFVLSDFIKIYKTITSSLNNNNNGNNSKLNSKDFSELLSNYIPVGIIDEKIIKLGNDYSNIGGMIRIKEEIYDTIALSLKCSEIFSNKLPIKLSSGILLVGPPGCGKTLIASALQKQFKINFYSIKGPEILNKYIGASEAAIREIFERAKKTIPCVIFFDEFDSVAPKRGTGSSGVTDRIVNQLLTYLDGIESREGVFVIGASSRPDLIDPAILRPGRLDKIILCDFPNLQERFDILNLYFKKAHSEIQYDTSNINQCLQFISESTEHFTGADLQSLIYNSFLIAVKRNISRNIDDHAVICEEDLLVVFKEFKRSVAENDIKFYNEIKEKFSSRTKLDSYEKESTTEVMKNLNENELKTTLY